MNDINIGVINTEPKNDVRSDVKIKVFMKLTEETVSRARCPLFRGDE